LNEVKPNIIPVNSVAIARIKNCWASPVASLCVALPTAPMQLYLDYAPNYR